MILGDSPDSVEKQAKFKEKYRLPFTLLADKDHKIAEAYGAWQEQSMMGKKYMGIVRSTVIIDPQGQVARFDTTAAPDSETTLDGNAVVVEEQMLKMAESRMAYDAAIGFYQKSMQMLRMAARPPGR